MKTSSPPNGEELYNITIEKYWTQWGEQIRREIAGQLGIRIVEAE